VQERSVPNTDILLEHFEKGGKVEKNAVLRLITDAQAIIKPEPNLL